MQSLVSAKWLYKNLKDINLVILDCSNLIGLENHSSGLIKYITKSGYENWLYEHIPNSLHADFSFNLCGDSSNYRNTLPAPERFIKEIIKLGVGNNTKVVLYDDTNSMWASRVWWMLRWIGFDNAGVLNGGLKHWKSQGLPTTNKTIQTIQTTQTKKQSLDLKLRSELFVTKETVLNSLEETNTCLIDALSEAQFKGEESDLGLSGHIPSAINVSAESLIKSNSSCYRPENELTELFPFKAFEKVIIYCGSGIAASSNAFTMARLGYKNVSIYMPGLQEWIKEEITQTIP